VERAADAHASLRPARLLGGGRRFAPADGPTELGVAGSVRTPVVPKLRSKLANQITGELA